VDLLPGMEPMIGKETIGAWLNGLEAQMKGAKVKKCDVDWQQIQPALREPSHTSVNQYTDCIGARSSRAVQEQGKDHANPAQAIGGQLEAGSRVVEQQPAGQG
jgi:hypothetical protein